VDSKWISLTPQIPATENHKIFAKIEEDFTLKGFYDLTITGLNALNYRNQNNAISQEEQIEKNENKHSILIKGFQVNNKDNFEQPIVQRMQFEAKDRIENIEDKIYISPLLFLKSTQNRFILNERYYPIDFISPWKDSYTVTIEIPEGYRIESIPQSVGIGISYKIGYFKYVVSEKGNILTVNFIEEFNHPFLDSKYYAEIKDMNAKMIAKHAEKVVLVKI
jgi:hypothetical protein